MSIGCIHGRFQPFHNGHLEYLKAAYALSERLIVGITQYDPAGNDPSSPAHRLDAAHNPFSYWERAELIRAAVQWENLDETRISIVPFPIDAPDKIRFFVDRSCIMYTTIYEKWSLEKIRRLKRQGFCTRVLWRRKTKQFEGRIVREAMEHDRQALQQLVPRGVYHMLNTHLFDQLTQLHDESANAMRLSASV